MKPVSKPVTPATKKADSSSSSSDSDDEPQSKVFPPRAVFPKSSCLMPFCIENTSEGGIETSYACVKEAGGVVEQF